MVFCSICWLKLQLASTGSLSVSNVTEDLGKEARRRGWWGCWEKEGANCKEQGAGNVNWEKGKQGIRKVCVFESRDEGDGAAIGKKVCRQHNVGTHHVAEKGSMAGSASEVGEGVVFPKYSSIVKGLKLSVADPTS